MWPAFPAKDEEFGMILKSLGMALRARDWAAVAIEFAIVVVADNCTDATAAHATAAGARCALWRPRGGKDSGT